jgi:hypothetical protein
MSDTKLVIAFDARIGNLETQLKKVTDALKKTDDQAKKSQSGFAGLGSVFTGLVGNIGGLSGAITGLAGVFGVGLGVGAAISGFMALSEAVGSLGEKAEQVGVSVEALQAWRLEGAAFNVEAAAMDGAISKLTRAIGEAAGGSESAQADFNRLGIAIRDSQGNIRSTEDVLKDIATAISQLPDAASRAAAAVSFFGRTGQALVPLLTDIGRTQRDVIQSSRDLGAVISTETSASFDKFGDALAVTGRIALRVAADMLAPVAEALGTILTRINEIGRTAAVGRRIASGEVVAGDTDAINERLTALRATIRYNQQLSRQQRERGQAGQAQVTEQRTMAILQEEQRLQGLLTQATETGEQARTDATTTAARVRADLVRSIMDKAASDLGISANRAAAARTGADALARFEETQKAAERTARVVEDATKRGITLTQDEINVIQANSLAIERNNGVRAASRTTRQTEEQKAFAEALRDSTSVLERMTTTARNPVDALTFNFTQVVDALKLMDANASRLTRSARDALANVGFEQFIRNAENGADRAAKAMEAAGVQQDTIKSRILESVRAYGESLVAIGRLTAEQVDEMMRRVDVVVERRSTPGTFTTGLRSGLGFNENPNQREIGFEETIGLGVGQQFQSSMDSVFTSLENVAEGSETAGEAFTKFAADFAKSVAKIVAQAALLQALKLAFNYFFPTTPAAGAGPGFGGGLASGGPVSGGMAYLVGERGPELFLPSGSGTIVSNKNSFGGQPQLVINNNSPGVVVTQERVDDRTVIASVNLSRSEVQRDFQRSMRTGYGSYAESMTGNYGVRRKL